jgi:hypothetical protein
MSGAALKPATARLDFLVVALPSSAFVCGVAVTILAPAAIGDVDFNRTRLTIWTTLLLACPALVLFVLRAGRIPLGLSWRAWWTAAYLAFVLHLVWGYGIMFRGDAGAVLRVQGTLVGVSNFLLAIIWGVSVLTAWAGWRRMAPAAAARVRDAVLQRERPGLDPALRSRPLAGGGRVGRGDAGRGGRLAGARDVSIPDGN